MNNEDNKMADGVMKAIEKVLSSSNGVTDASGNEGVNLLTIVKKISRNRRKGESLE